MQDQIYNMLLQKDEVTWQTIIYELVKTEQLDPWNIDISLLAKKYVETIQKLHDHNFFISGKVLLASAILLKIKSEKLLTEYIAAFDSQLFPQDESILDNEDQVQQQVDIPHLLIKTPQPRKKQITLNDLMSALEKALDVDERRKMRKMLDEIEIRKAELPEKKIDITKLIKDVYEKIVNMFSMKQRLTFEELVGSDRKEDKILTLIPLLYLDSKQKIDLKQDIPFGEILITLGE